MALWLGAGRASYPRSSAFLVMPPLGPRPPLMPPPPPPPLVAGEQGVRSKVGLRFWGFAFALCALPALPALVCGVWSAAAFDRGTVATPLQLSSGNRVAPCQKPAVFR
jgi:hypothetical protein